MEKFKYFLYIVLGVMGSIADKCLGGNDNLIQGLVILMGLDLFTAIIVAIIGRSPKSKNGGVSSTSLFFGVLKKFVMMIVVAVCTVADKLIGSDNFVRNSGIIALCVGELVSLVENFGLMGIKTEFLSRAIDVLKERGESNADK